MSNKEVKEQQKHSHNDNDEYDYESKEKELMPGVYLTDFRGVYNDTNDDDTTSSHPITSTSTGNSNSTLPLGQLPDHIDIDTIVSSATSSSSSSSSSSLSASSTWNHDTTLNYNKDTTLTALQLEISELENSIYHLQRSNQEMLQYIADGMDDSDNTLKESIEENRGIIENKKQNISILENLMKEIQEQELLLKQGSKSIASSDHEMKQNHGMTNR